jgi:beta-xylosidase
VVAIVIALSATALHGSADASVARSSVVRTPRIADGRLGGAAAPISQLGAAAADATLGMRIAYYEPAALTDTAAPGTTILGGPDTPDPFIAAQDGTYYLFTSQGTQPANVPVMSGSTVGQWGPMTDALPDLPAWAEPGGTWAPDAQRFGNHYVLYFTAAIRDPNARIECIGDAVSTKLAGPYISAAAPFICQLAQGGSIDPRTFIDSNGQPYLLWKSDENSDVSGTSLTNIYSQPLSADGLHLLGQPTRIFGPDEPWQGRIVEAPDLVLVKGAYYLFYSGGWFNQPGYAIGVATCAGPAGPCADTSPSPLLSSNDQGVGPGEESVFSNARGIWLVYTPFRSTLPLPGPPRPVAMAHLGFGPTGPYLAAPESVGTGG